ncbi:MAG: ABC transporter ATP-binding protein [Candidatus Kapaibacterium sp.]|nr:MAG: ABC transporter ATP-binding protein [Candidatus Kapabacteria bacterium]
MNIEQNILFPPESPPFQGFELRANALTQKFNNRLVWRNLSLSVKNGEVLGITGQNGSGKTTLLRALAGLLQCASGSVECFVQGGTLPIPQEEIVRHIGFVAPYLTLYEEFTPLELLQFLTEMRGERFSTSLMKSRSEALLQHFHLWERRDDEIRTFSSGMKQRCKFICALQHNPPLLVFDEPMTNLDEQGISAVEEYILLHKSRNGAALLATNDARDLALCSAQIRVMDFAIPPSAR